MSEVLSAPIHEALPPTETDIKKYVTPSVSRLAFAAIDTKFYDPQERTVFSFETDAVKKAGIADISYQAITEQSLDDRASHWQKKAKETGISKTFAAQNKEWNSELAAWIQKSEGLGPDEISERKNALESLGFHLDDPTKWQMQSYEFTDFNTQQRETVELVRDVEDFRRKYFRGRVTTEPFITDLANGCRPAAGEPVDLALLEKRLHAVKDLFVLFGTEKSSDELIREHVRLYGLLTQSPDKKEQIAETAAKQLETGDLDQKLKKGFENLYEKQSAILKGETKPYPDVVTQAQTEKLADENELKEKVEKAKNEALSEEQLTELRDKVHTLDMQFKAGKITATQLADEMVKISDRNKGLIENLETLDELRITLHLLDIETQKIDEIVEHEKAHYEEALSHNRNPAFEIQIGKNPDGSYAIHPATTYDSFNKGDLMQIDVLAAPGLKNLSHEDIRDLHLEAEDIEDTLVIVESPDIVQKTNELTAYPNEKDARRARNQIHIATVIAMNKQKQAMEQLVIPRTTSPTPPQVEIPTQPLSAKEIFNAYITTLSQRHTSPQEFTQRMQNDPEIQTIITQYEQEGRFSEAFYRFTTKLTKELEGSPVSLEQKTSLADMLKPDQYDPFREVILPYAPGRIGLIKPDGQSSVIRTKQDEILVKVHDIHEGKDIHVPLRSLFQTDVSFLQAFQDPEVPISSKDEFDSIRYAQAIVISEAAPEDNNDSPPTP